MRRRAPTVLAALALLAAAPLLARPAAGQPSVVPLVEPEEEASALVPRLPMSRATEKLVSVDGASAVILTPDALLLQLTDDGVAQAARAPVPPPRQPRVARFLASFFGAFARSSPDHAVRCDLSRVADVRVGFDGRLVLTGNDGREIRITGPHGRRDRFDPTEARTFAARVKAAANARRSLHD
ncbi:hypothetical protein [Roseisolibacter sp. H3M3-2]|uniref:hypothetical protein n=1 Tax=Roseisolibacter sp. H3M3-2 TaxID=3031323 RepID=UPI0023DA990C|nr:hypothetical protein [Roseisolibacter sp. H3M3-2]MDF1502444.1 hypothetical protein [Roseisolibacter sp. H3M3-2]